MKKILLILSVFLCTYLFADFSKKATCTPILVQDGIEKQWCPITGLNIADYYKTSYIAKLKANGRYRQYSCLTALAIDMIESGIDTNSIKAMDAKQEKYINANNGYFLQGSTIAPTFGTISTLAFENKPTALEYSKKYGGKIVNFHQALLRAKKNIDKDISQMKKIYEKKLYIMGEKIYHKECKKIDLSDFIEINELKGEIVKDKLCKDMDENYLQALALYLWNVKREGGISNKTQKVKVNKDEKCPVCGMFVYKYPRWAAQIFYKHGNHEHHLSFDGVKDMMKFYFNNQKWGKYPYAGKKNITKILVTDYYKQYAVDARGAYFVIGSNIYGPMGHELIPFSTLDEAKNFKNDHKGTKILKFNEIKNSLPYELDTK